MNTERHFSPAAPPSTERRRAIHKQLEAARYISEALFQHTKVDDLIAKALAIALEVTGAEAGLVLLADSATNKLVFHHSIGVNPVPYGTAIPWDKGIAGAAFQSWKPGGTGLGTKIVKDVVDAHGGRITVESEEGVGTTFHLRFPIHHWLPRSVH